MRLCYFFVLSLFLCSTASAIEVVPSNAKHSALVSELIEKNVQPILSSLNEAEQRALSPVQVKVVGNLIASDIALSLGGEFPRVLISNQFIEGLDAYAEAYVVGLYEEKPNFTEQYFHHYFWNNHPDFSGTELDSPIAFSDMTSPQQALLLQRKQELLESALMDILLHELGHHAESAFYNYKASFYVKQEMEKLADDWAIDVRERYLPQLDPLGRLLSIAFVFERDRWSMLSGDANYPRMINWIADNADPVCEDAVAEHVQRFCIQLEKNLSVYFSSKAEVAYRDRVDSGEEFATFPLAQVLLKKSRYHLACSYFKESHDNGNIKRAAVYVAWCYLNGFLNPSSPDAEILAWATSRDALIYGYTDTSQYIQSLNQFHQIQ